MEPSIVDAVKADNESGPFVLIISESMAIEPEPDIGLISANGSSYANPDIDSTFWHAKTVDGFTK